MTDWLHSKAYDDWKCSPPEDNDGKRTKCHCAWCDEDLYFDEEYYEIDGEVLCEDCAGKWLADHKHWVSESMAYD